MKIFGKKKRYIKELENKLGRYKEENNNLKDGMMIKRKTITDLKNGVMDLNSRLDILIKTNNELKTRRDEFLKRLKSQIPDNVIGGKFENYKYWLAESFIVDKYKHYHGVDDNEVFVDQFAVQRNLSKVLKDEEKESG